MKIAIVHDSLVEFGGAERVLLAILELFPDADVYTAYADKAFVETFFSQLVPSHLFPSWADGTIVTKHGSLFQLCSSLVWRSFDLEKYDLVLSLSGYLGSNMVSVKRPVHIEYVHSLPKNLYGLDPVFWLQKIVPYGSLVARIIQKSLVSSPYIFSNSKYTSRVVYKKTGIRTRVIYPPVNIPSSLPKRRKARYYVCLSRIDASKNLEIAIEACTKLKLPLKIIGKTNDINYERFLRTIAGPSVEFLGFLSDEKARNLYRYAIAFIFTAKNEDFGIAPLEAMAHGVPVIAFFGGGLKETVIPGKTGVFFYKHSVDALVNTLRTFQPQQFSPLYLHRHARQFSKQKFQKKIYQRVRQAMGAPVGRYNI